MCEEDRVRTMQAPGTSIKMKIWFNVHVSLTCMQTLSKSAKVVSSHCPMRPNSTQPTLCKCTEVVAICTGNVSGDKGRKQATPWTLEFSAKIESL